MAALVCLALWFIAWPLLCLWRAYVVVVLWTWFGLPFTNLAAPSLFVVTGMMLVLHTILPFPRYRDEKSDKPLEAMWTHIVYYGVTPAMMLGAGWYWKWLQWGVS